VSDDEAKEPERSDAKTGGEAAEASKALAKVEPEAGEAGEAGEAKAGDDEAQRRDLPKWNRARVKRKAPAGEEQDAFQASVRKAGRGFLQRPGAIIGLIVAVAAVGAGAYAWMQHGESQRADTTAVLATAVAYEARGQVVEGLEEEIAKRSRPLPYPVVAEEAELRQKVDEALTNLEEMGSDTPANVAADLVRAARLARASDYEGAEKAFRGFVDRQPGHPLVFLARDGLVISLEAQKRYDDALEVAEQMLGGEGDFFRDQALWHKGRLLEAAERPDEALAVYEQYVAEYPLEQPSQAQTQVRARLEELKPELVPDTIDPSMMMQGMMPGMMPGGAGGFAP